MFSYIQKNLIALLFLTFLFSIPITVSAQDAAAGAKLFTSKCSGCHNVTDQAMVGPGLQGVESRWPDKAKLSAWIRNSSEFLKTGDAYANALYKEYGGKQMSAFPSLSDGDITNILAYIANPAAGKPAATGGAAATAAPEATTKSDSKSGAMTYIVLGSLALLAILAGVLASIRKSLQSVVNEKQGLPEPVEENLTIGQKWNKWRSANGKLLFIASVILVLSVVRMGWNAGLAIGVNVGYAPTQPIKFSHKIHAGENKIQCQYCHSGVEKSKHANIPSASVCLNCHMKIQEGPTYGKEEIGKIYAATGFNPKTMKVDKPSKPIEWVSVHALPDHVYFNHSQHVKVGGIECNKCHGSKDFNGKPIKIEEMEVVTKVQPLTMGWCINCHRETNVQTKDNDYYAAMHAEFKKSDEYKKDKNFTIGKIGGLECAKCHY